MEATNFSQPLRQSSKGIIIIFAFNAVQFIKKFFVLFIAFGVSFMRRQSFGGITPTMIILGLIAIMLIILIIAILKYLNFKFHLSKDDFHLATGIINKDNTIIPKTKIQNVYIKQNFLQQLINVVSVKIETAGDKKSEIEISALDKPTALLLKKKLFLKAAIENTPLEQHEKRNVFFKISPKRLFLEGVSQNHFKSFLLIFAFIFGLYSEFQQYLEELKIEERIEDIVQLDEDTLFNLLLTNIVILILVVLVSFLFSIIKTFIINFNLEVVEHQKTIEINKGLFNKVSLSLTPSRIQNLVIKTNRLKQYFNLHSLSVKQAMVNAKQQKNFKIVALEKEQLNYLTNKLLTHYNSEIESAKPRPYFMRISALKMLIFGGVVNIITLGLIGVELLWINAVFIPIAMLYVYIGYKKAYYKITDHFITIGSGIIDTTTNILEIHKIQAIKLKQTVFQKRQQISSVIIYTASKSVTIPYINEKDALHIYNFLLYKVESQDKDWM
ncbi:PH domain-containing protein [Winogradskyella bathintestinalis]|uniref:PH domain-containing protein n=1 Tax=Winogradskyella bathintestinalis TaxID=3035208 RepID=A0ABT7ZWN3_9FLAO|nr:PH domain-containing protein [Winogradskyella bathintestinalis]MDN3493148.1 PH domain-containing protein [Winogradskyella bathintestinalis]